MGQRARPHSPGFSKDYGKENGEHCTFLEEVWCGLNHAFKGYPSSPKTFPKDRENCWEVIK